MIGQFPQLKGLNLKCCYRLTDAGLAEVSALTQLGTLNISKCRKAGDAAAEAIATLPRLQVFVLS